MDKKYFDIEKNDVGAEIAAIHEKDEKSLELLNNVANVSSNDNNIGNKIIEIIKEISFMGSIDVKESNFSKTKIITTAGMKTHKGAISSFMYNDLKNYKFIV